MRTISCFAILAAAAAAQGAPALEAPAYLIDLPEDWEVSRGADLAGVQQETKAAAGLDAPGQAIDLRAHPPGERAVEVNVVVSDAPIAVDEQALTAFRSQFVALMREAGAEARVVDSSLRPVAGRRAIALDVEVDPAGLEEPRRQWTVAVPASDTTLVFTMKAPAAEFERYAPTFESVLGSVAFVNEGPAVQTLEDWYVRGAVLGIVAILAAAVFVFTATRNKRREDKYPAEGDDGA
jgi:hypothetical protein